VAQLDLLTPAEQQTLLVGWNETYVNPIPLPVSMGSSPNRSPDSLMPLRGALCEEGLASPMPSSILGPNQLAHTLQPNRKRRSGGPSSVSVWNALWR